MNIAYTVAPGRGDTDLTLHCLSQSLIVRGYRPVGTVQINTEREDAGPCDMNVKVLPEGPVILISQSLGRASKGCRLDPNALETAVGFAETELNKGADCLIINKFGRHEAEGRGFRLVIAKALEKGIPVLVGLNRLNQEAFLEFAENMATELPPEASALETWVTTNISMSQDAA